MKQIPKTPEVTAALRQSVGATVNIDNLAVYEAIAFNNRPVRKNHPLFKGAIADRSLLLEMAAALSQESRPIRIEHNDDGTPFGRAFYGSVKDQGSQSELRVLFFVDKTEEKIANKIDSGTIDQVSVSILPKQMLNSVSGFDYLGPEAKPENFWTGADNDGNTIGQKGVHARMVGLDKWFELSLVGQGGAEGARIVSHDESYFGSSYQKLAASGIDPSQFVLVASTENETMDLTALTDKLVNLSAANATFTADIATLTASNTAMAAEIVTLKAAVEAAGQPDEALAAATASLAEKTTEVETLTADNASAVVSLKDVAKRILVASGKVDAAVPETVAELTALIAESAAKLKIALVADGVSSDPITDAEAPKVVQNYSAYRRPPTGRK